MSGFLPKHGIPPIKATHFLCYPLYSPGSRLQLQNLVQRLRDDQLTFDCPQKSFRMPKAFNLPIIRFHLNTQVRVDAVLECLRNLDINRMLKDTETAATAANFNIQNEVATKATIREDAHKAWDSPLSISLVGLSGSPCSDKVSRKVNASPIDTTNRLRFLTTQIFQRFASMGIVDTDTHEDFPPRANLITTMKAKFYRRFKAEGGATRRLQMSDPYNPQDLIEKYKDAELAESIPLEKLSLCKSDRISTFKGERNQILVDEYYEEVESIPLPQQS